MAVNVTERQISQSSVRLLQIMECLAGSRYPMKLQDIAKAVGTTQSTVLRYLYSLEHANYIYKEEVTSRYALTWKICGLSDNLNSTLSLRNIASSSINRLSSVLSLGVCLAVEDHNECMYLDCTDSPSYSTLQRIGKRAPLHATGSGKLLLSRLSPRQLNEYIEERGLTKYTSSTITDPDLLIEELNKIRKQDFAMDEEECEPDLRCISCPIRDFTGDIIAAISVFGHLYEMTDQHIQSSVYPMLKTAANEISLRLGYHA